MTREQIIAEKELFLSQIKKYCAPFRKLLGMDMTLREYSKNLYAFDAPEKYIERQGLIKEKIRGKLHKLFGENYQTDLSINLEDKLVLNISDHHQVLNHPFLISPNVISSVNKFCKKEKQDAIIVISSGDVPPNNFFSKNGFQYNDKRIPLFSNSERELTSYYIPLRDFNFIERLKNSKKWAEFNAKEQEFLFGEYTKIQSFDFSKCENYIDQISVIVKETWPYLFEEKLRATLPELIYITQEELITDCLLSLLNEDNIVSRCLFDKDLREIVIKNFHGNVITWGLRENKGTHFFWRKYPDRNQSINLFVEGDNLVPSDPRFKDCIVPLEKNTIIEMLGKKEIYPSLFTIFSVLNFYAGVKPLTGYGSTVYLDLMKQSWLKTICDYSDFKEEIELIETIDTYGLIAGPAIFFKRCGDKLKALYAYDIFADGGVSEDYLSNAFNLNAADCIAVGLADMYRSYFSKNYIPKDERVDTKLTVDDLAKITFSWL